MLKYKIEGSNLQLVTISLDPGQVVYAEAGAMNHMSGNVEFKARAKGGLLGGLKRSISGESFFVTEFQTTGGPGIVAFGGAVPGTLREIKFEKPEDVWMFQKDAFLCAENHIQLDIAFQKKLGAGFFGGEGFIIQKMFAQGGPGNAFIHGCGDFVDFDLAPGQMLKIDTGSVVGWQGTVKYDIQRAGNLKTSILGGEGVFLTTLTGPGKVILQSMTLKNLAMALQPFFANTSGGGGTNLFG